ncbi:hypothetical protein LU298_01450 [Komagataeibacter intermedius]|uniref:hypothetical protein n=1 Tax=Komagataeibacter intermedius TaxID=66229 RepID=UPI00130189C9|nr:hypothetical protein [Komagataeibacter intermedius]MCF3635172.1 hypothetical protein [Komagataeibacter intermedius]
MAQALIARTGCNRETGIAGSGRKPALVVPFERTGEPGCRRLAARPKGKPYLPVYAGR